MPASLFSPVILVGHHSFLALLLRLVISVRNKGIQAKVDQVCIHFIYRFFEFFADNLIQLFGVKL